MSDRVELAEERTEAAEFRTDVARDRTLLANERTFAGWLRTALTSVAVAIGLHAVFRDVEPSWAPRAIATVFALAAAGMTVSAAQEARRTRRRLDNERATVQPVRRILALAGAVTLAALGTVPILWMI
ncbi:DUF202 domain-containing protein [Rhodosalinus halophilus]|uniref:DUF202 domain-containing protein n=1 Tax=Rhodosalinus halophilus TaxID=2259333 RepID=A0A365UAR0_9RHOB|nr:DUF202 domain-containing protein [Rhodosalinus halophilus]RBI86300.1 DUF202 domain-containing protein [Rhodosalinus halophilus]